jgi:Asp-tRNA(Asn)/Glu-tRNA(Gln) amidotransferase C subunit
MGKMKKIDRDEVNRLADLAMLPLNTQDIALFTDEMNTILDFFSAVEKFSAGDGETRTDKAGPRNDGNCTSSAEEADMVVGNFPAKESRLLLVPRGSE